MIKAESSEEDEGIVLLAPDDDDNEDKKSKSDDEDEIKHLNKILELEKLIEGKNQQITDMIKKLEEANKKIEELKQTKYLFISYKFCFNGFKNISVISQIKKAQIKLGLCR